MTIIVLDGQGGGIGRALIAALLPQLPEGAQLLCCLLYTSRCV